jgi:hypothetical protein
MKKQIPSIIMSDAAENPFSPYSLDVDDDRDMLRVSGRETDTIHLFFTSWQQQWPQPLNPLGYDFLNTAIRYNLQAVCLRDPSNRWFHSGVRGLGRTIDAVRDELKRETEGYEHIVTVGSSMGGYGALLFGGLLDADVAVGIVPQIHVGSSAAAEIADARFAADYAAIDRESSTPQYCRLETLMRTSRTQSVIIIGDSDQDDSANAGLVQGQSGVEVLTLEGADHNGAARACLTSRVLSQFLDGSFQSGAPLNADLVRSSPPPGREIV